MIQLAQRPLPQSLTSAAKYAHERLSPGKLFRTAIWCSGRGPWNDFLPTKNDNDYSFVTQEGERISGTRKGIGAIMDLQTALADCLAIFYGPHGWATAPRYAGCVILRANSMIVLFTQADLNHRYVPFPQLSAHERIADIVAIEREFPGIFEFQGGAAT